MKRTVLFVVLLAACAPGGDGAATDSESARERDALQWIHRLDEPAVFERVVKIGSVSALQTATGADYPLRVRLAAVRALDEVSGTEAFNALLDLAENSADEDVKRHARAALDGVDLAAEERQKREREAAAKLRAELETQVSKGPDRVTAIWRAHDEGLAALVDRAAADTDPIVRAHARAARAGRSHADAKREIDKHLAAEKDARAFLPMLANPAVRDTLVKKGAVWTLVAGTRNGPMPARRQAFLGLGRVKDRDDIARDRLIEQLQSETPDAVLQGQLKLYAAVGLTLRADPGTAVDLLLALSTVDPNDNVKALSDEGVRGAYYTVDAQICEALMKMGLWNIEEELVDQMKRRAWIRVLIDSHAILRRETGLALPFDYNGSYERRDAQAEAWRTELRKTRAQREAKRSFRSDDPHFQKRLAFILAWLRGRSVNNRYIAEKVLIRLGRISVPSIIPELERPSPIAQRQAALMLGRIGDPSAREPLRRWTEKWTDPDAIARGLEALRLLEDDEATSLARAMLKHEDAEVRAQAANLIGARRDKESRAALTDALASERLPATATKLRCALLLVGDTDMVAPLLKAFVEGDQPSREAAYDALTAHRGKAPAADPLAPIEERRQAAAEFGEK